jgi:hypothetical protein
MKVYILSHALLFQIIHLPILAVTVLKRLEGLICLQEKSVTATVKDLALIIYPHKSFGLALCGVEYRNTALNKLFNTITVVPRYMCLIRSRSLRLIPNRTYTE